MELEGGTTGFAVRLAVAVLVVVAGWVMVRLIGRSVDRFLAYERGEPVDPSLRTRFNMIKRLSSAVVMFLAVALALYLLDAPILRRVALGMFASAGIVGIALGLAAQTTAANLVSGIMISFVQPLRIGDRVHVGGEAGEVEEVGLFYTRVKTWDNRRLLVPNQSLASSPVKNYTLVDGRMPAIVVFTLAPESDAASARESLETWVRTELLRPSSADGASAIASEADPSRLSAAATPVAGPGVVGAVPRPDPRLEVTGRDGGKALLRAVVWARNFGSAWDLSVRLARDGEEYLCSQGFEVVGYAIENEGPGTAGI